MARNAPNQQATPNAQEASQAPAPGRAPQQGGTAGIPQRQAAQGAFPEPQRAYAPKDDGPKPRRFKVKPSGAGMSDAQLKGGYRIMQPSSGAPGAVSYTAILPAGRIITDASHDIGRLRAQGVELEELDPPPPPKVEEPEAPVEEPEAKVG